MKEIFSYAFIAGIITIFGIISLYAVYKLTHEK